MEDAPSTGPQPAPIEWKHVYLCTGAAESSFTIHTMHKLERGDHLLYRGKRYNVLLLKHHVSDKAHVIELVLGRA